MRKAIIAISALILSSLAADAQSWIANESLVHDGKTVTVTFDIETKDNSIPANRKEVILPYIYNEKDTLWLDPVEVFGKGYFKRQKQEHFLAGNGDLVLADGQILKGSVYSYRDTAPLKRWMQPAKLGIRTNIIGCNCENSIADQQIAQTNLFEEPALPARRIPQTFTLTEAARQWNFGQDELEIIFKVGSIEIDSTVFNNEVTFGRILSAVDKIFANPNFKLDQIEIAGYASPEGNIKFNQWLGENRAKALIDYIIAQRPEYSLTREHFRIRNGEENWEGLRRLTLASNIPDEEKQQIVRILDSDAGLARKDMLKGLNGGKTYMKMITEVYPHLRCSRYLAIYYDSTQDNVVDAINAANQLLAEGKAAQAYEALKPYSDDLRAYNSIGVALMLQGEFEKAVPWFQKAIENDFPTAQENIDLINAELEYEALKRKEHQEYLKSFE